MTIHFCDTNIILGYVYKKDNNHDKCRKLLFNPKKNIIISKRSFNEIKGITKRNIRFISKIREYLIDKEEAEKKFTKKQLMIIKTFIKNCERDISILTKMSDQELFQEVRDYNDLLERDSQQIYLFKHIDFVCCFDEISQNIDPIKTEDIYNIALKYITEEIEYWDGDRNLFVDAICHLKLKSKKGFKKLIFISNDSHFIQNKEGFEQDTNVYFTNNKLDLSLEILSVYLA